MITISLNVGDDIERDVVEILGNLAIVAEKGQNRAVRIGGAEYRVNAKQPDAQLTLTVDGQTVTDWLAAHPAPIAPTPAPVIPTAPVAPVSTQNDDDDDVDVDDNDALIRAIVCNHINAGTMFTAWDITKEAKGRGASGRHRDLKMVVHGMYRDAVMADYVREQVDIVGVAEQPFLYYPPTEDPDNYVQMSGAQAV